MLYVLITQFDAEVCRPRMFSNFGSAKREMYMSALEFLKKRSLTLVDYMGVEFAYENINRIIEDGFYVEENSYEAQGVYEVEFNDDKLCIDMFDNERYVEKIFRINDFDIH